MIIVGKHYRLTRGIFPDDGWPYLVGTIARVIGISVSTDDNAPGREKLTLEFEDDSIYSARYLTTSLELVEDCNE